MDLCEAMALLESIQDAVDGKSVSDFMSSFPLVREVIDLRQQRDDLSASVLESKVDVAKVDEVEFLITKLANGRPVRHTRLPYGRTFAVYNADVADQRGILGCIEEQQQRLSSLVGGPVTVVFHSVKQTAERYPGIARTGWPWVESQSPSTVLTPAEHSRLVYLLDALQAAPAKRKALIAMADVPGSASYREKIIRLRGVPEVCLLALVDELKDSLK